MFVPVVIGGLVLAFVASWLLERRRRRRLLARAEAGTLSTREIDDATPADPLLEAGVDINHLQQPLGPAAYYPHGSGHT
jgi:hypothetical protein